MSWELPPTWAPILADEVAQPYFHQLRAFVEDERRRGPVYPAPQDVFQALALTPYPAVRVVLLGQDPYHGVGQAHGLCFSVPPGVRPPPSLVNVFRELEHDLGCSPPAEGCLKSWARRGVLLLNTVLTVRSHQPHSHRGRGWERFTDTVIRRINDKPARVVFMLWGRPAQEKAGLVDPERHAVVSAAHPSPLSARRGFFGTRPFSAVNRELEERMLPPIDWRLPGESATNHLPKKW